MYVIVIIWFTFACIMHFVRESIEIIFKKFRPKEFRIKFLSTKGRV